MQYKAIFYAGVGKHHVYPLGFTDGETNLSLNEISEFKDPDFKKSLFDEFNHKLKILGTVPFVNDPKNVNKVFIDQYAPLLIIYFFIGPYIPSPKVTRIALYDPNRGPPPLEIREEGQAEAKKLNRRTNLNSKGYFFELTVLSIMCNNNITFLALVNTFMKRCTPQDHAKLLERTSSLRFSFHSDHYSLSPYAYGYYKSLNQNPPEYRALLQSCPEDMLPCQMFALHAPYIFFINKKKWTEKSTILLEDIKSPD